MLYEDAPEPESEPPPPPDGFGATSFSFSFSWLAMPRQFRLVSMRFSTAAAAARVAVDFGLKFPSASP